MKIPYWAHLSLMRIDKYINIQLILNCKNTKNKKKIFKHFFYYLINLECIRNRL